MPDREVKILIDVIAETAVRNANKVKSVIDDIGKQAEKTSRQRVSSEDKAAREVERINKQTARQAEASNRVIEQSDRKLADVRSREAKRAANDFLKTLKQVENGAAQSAKSTQSAFQSAFSGGVLGGFAGAISGAILNQLAQIPSSVRAMFDEVTQIAQERQNALKGLESVALFKGIDDSATKQAVQNLRLVKAGVVDIASASTALKNLLQTNFTLEQSVALLERFSDTAAFGKQSALTYARALESVGEGLKNNNPLLLDNAGMSKNLSVIMKEMGKSQEDAGRISSDASIRLAAFNGIMRETAGQVGDADRLVQGYTGSVAALSNAKKNLYAAIGDIITRSPELIALINVWTGQINKNTDALSDNESQQAKTFSSFIAWAGKAGLSATNFANLTYAVTSDVANALRRVVAAVEVSMIYSIDKTRATVDFMGAVVGAKIDAIIAQINSITGVAGIPAIPQFGIGEADVATAENRFNQLNADFDKVWKAMEGYFDAQNGWFSRSRKALTDNADRWTEFRFQVKAAEDALKKDGKANRPLSGSVLPGGSSDGKAKKVELSPQGKALIDAAQKLGVSPLDLAMIIGFETGGTYSPNKVGGEGNKFRGLIQFGQAEQKQFGVYAGQSFADQLMNSVVPYFQQRFAQAGRTTQGASLQDLYTTVIAGNPNANPNARDAFGTSANSGVARMIRDQRAKALKLLGGEGKFENFALSSQVDSTTKKLLDGLSDLQKAKERILEITKELGLNEKDYQVSTIEGAQAVLKRLDTLKSFSGNLTRESEGAKKSLDEMATPKRQDQLNNAFQQLNNNLNLTATEAEVLNKALKETTTILDEIDNKSKTRPRVVPWQLLPGNEWGLQFQGDPNKQRDGSDRKQIRDFNELKQQLQDQFDEVNRGSRTLTEFERVQRDIERNYKNLSEAQKEDLLNTAKQIDATNQFLSTQEKLKGFFTNVFDKAIGGEWKSLLDDMLNQAKSFFVKLGAQFVTSQFMRLLGGSGQQSGGFNLGSLFGLGGNSQGGGLNLGSIFSGNQGGGIFNLIGGLFGGGSTIGGATASAAGLGSILTLGGTHAVAAAAPSALSAGLAGGASAGAGLLGGLAGAGGGIAGMLGGLAPLLTNPWTAVAVGGAIGGYFLFKKLFSESPEKKLRKAAESAYSPLKIKDKNILKSLKGIGEGTFGKGQAGKKANEVVRLEASKDLLTNYAEATGQKVPKLTDGDLTDEFNPRNNFSSRFSGFAPVPVSPSISTESYSSGSTTARTSSSTSQASLLMLTLVQLTDSIEKFTNNFSVKSEGVVVGNGLAQNPAAAADAYHSELKRDSNRSTELKRLTLGEAT